MKLNPPKHNIAQVSLVFIVLFLGFFFRFYSLDHLSYWGDEETSSLPARSLALGEGAKFPSGMEYRRGLPHTYLMAQTAKRLGTDSDYSYRLPSAVLGSLTLLVFFFLVYRFFGINIALVATILLSFSEWHILLSRTARMYGPMLLFTVIFYYFIFLWHQQKRLVYLFGSALSFLASVSFNFLAIFALPLFLIPLLFKRLDFKYLTISAVASGFVTLASIAYFKIYVTAPYRELAPADFHAQDVSDSQNVIDLIISQISFATIATTLVSLILALLTYRRLHVFNTFKNNFISEIFLFSCILGVYLFGLPGHFFASFLFSVFIISVIDIRSPSAIVALKLPTLVLFSVLSFWLLFNINEYGTIEGLKQLFKYPFPYILHQAIFFYGVIILFFIGLLYSVLTSGDRQHLIRAAGVSYLIVSLFVGLMFDWPPPRYMITVYPLLIIVSSYGLVCVSDQIQSLFGKVRFLRYLLILVLPASGVLGGHGFPQAMKTVPGDHSMLIYSNHIQGIIYPDHRSLGCFVKGHLKANDIVVAQDALQQYWYVGKVDYWLRQPESIDSYVFKSNGVSRDIYVLSEPTSDEIINKLINTKERIWVITSGEVYNFKDNFLGVNTPQRNWINHVEDPYKPIITGLDNASAVYCINCSNVLAAPKLTMSGACSENTY
jgi:4-amino-4-deoxy-L-arabinose transferase-like glycosyltransferase